MENHKCFWSKGKKGNVALKIDISNVYDQINWKYLEATMRKLGFASHFIDMIMLCVTTVQYNINVNSDLVGLITPGRGLRQSDPLSSYMFIICVKGLSALIKQAKAKGDFHGCHISRGAPSLSQLLFIDDNFFFFYASKRED